MKFIKNILNILPAIIGILQSGLPVIKEVVVSVVRLIAILPLLWDCADPIIEKVNEVYDKIYGWVEKIKNITLLG